MKLTKYFRNTTGVFLFLATSAWATTAPSPSGKLPDNWYRLPEDRSETFLDRFSFLENTVPKEKPDEGLANSVDRLLGLNQKILDRMPDNPSKSAIPGDHPKDWAPWHLEFFTTDLSVSAQGLIGLNTFKGSPAVQVYWRKQGSPHGISPAAATTPITIHVESAANPGNSSNELEPAIQAALATGKIDDEKAFRANAKTAHDEFLALIQAMDTRSGSQWWASGFRLDFQIAGSGTLLPTFTTVGGDLRLRFEWKRLKRNQPIPSAPPRSAALREVRTIRENLRDFVSALEMDLEQVISEQASAGSPFQPHGFRIGIGVSAKGDVGVAKGTVTAWGHVMFSRDVTKPIVYPAQRASLDRHESPILIIENAPAETHLAFAHALNIPLSIEKGNSFLDGEDVPKAIYQVARERFRAGLGKAYQMGLFFADRGNTSTGPGWKVFQMKTSFDISVTGDFGFAGFSALGTAEIAFWNQNF